MSTPLKTKGMVSLIALLALTGAATGHAAGAEAGKVIELPDADRQLLEQLLGEDVVGRAAPARPIDDPTRFLPPTPTTLEYRFSHGGRKERTVEHVVQPEGSARSETRWRYTTGSEDVAFLGEAADGSISVATEEDWDHKVVTRFTPAKPVLIKGIRPGESRDSQIKVRVYELKNPEREVYHGSLKLTHSYVGAYQIRVPAGQYTASLLKWHYKGKVGPARIDVTQYRFYVPGTGVVAMADRKEIRAFLIYRNSSKRGQVLVREPVGGLTASVAKDAGNNARGESVRSVR